MKKKSGVTESLLPNGEKGLGAPSKKEFTEKEKKGKRKDSEKKR